MLRKLAAWAILAAVLVNGVPTINPVDVEFDIRDVEADRFDTLEHDIEARASVTSQGSANFERLNTSGLGINDIGYYGGLYWTGIAAVSAGDGGLVAAIRPRSPTNVGAYGAVTKLLNNRPFITSRYRGSRTQSFGINSLFFGCNGAVLTLPVSCRIAVAGYDNFNRLVAYQTFNFNPTGKLLSDMKPAVLAKSFSSGLSTVRFATAYEGLNVIGSTSFDNIRYTIVQNTAAALTKIGLPISPIDPSAPALVVNSSLII